MWLVWKDSAGRMRTLRIDAGTLREEGLRAAIADYERRRTVNKAALADALYHHAKRLGDGVGQQDAIRETEWWRKDKPALLRLKLHAALTVEALLAIAEAEDGSGS